MTKYILASFLVVASVQASDLKDIFRAIGQVESGNRDNAPWGDGGKSRGRYQIQKDYHTDSRVPGNYARVTNKEYAERVMIGYWKRYCPDALRKGDAQTLARVHNGGPAGHKKSATLGYWNKVNAVLKKIEKAKNVKGVKKSKK